MEDGQQAQQQTQHVLDRSFYDRNTIEVAKDLLGCILIHKTEEGITSGKIVETEACLTGDPLTYGGINDRNRIMFGNPGYAHIYLIYKNYYGIILVAREEGIGEGVVLRALEPIEGIDIMKKRRNTTELHNLCDGPIKLLQAMGIRPDMNGQNITKGNFVVSDKNPDENIEIVKTPRIGIKKGPDLLLRFYIKDNHFISKKR